MKSGHSRRFDLATITFITPFGQQVVAEAEEGTIMEAAVDFGVVGIDAVCGGMCSCATCHVHVDPEWVGVTGRAEDDEKELLEFEDSSDPYSRLSCQMPITEALDGLVLRVAKR